MRWPWQRAPEPDAGPEAVIPGQEGPVDVSEYGDTSPRQHLVPASRSLGQILDYYNGSGDAGMLGLYSFSGAGAVFQFAALARCIEFVSATVASLITDPEGLIVLDRDGVESKTRTARTGKRLLTWSPDGGETSAHEWMEDAVADYCTSGNFVAAVVRSSTFPYRLVRMNPWTSSAHGTPAGLRYDLQESEAGWGGYMPRSMVRLEAREVVHARWPRLRSAGAYTGQRMRFAAAPIQVLRPALGIGIAGDRHIAEWFVTGGSGSQAAIVFKDTLENEEQRTEFDRYLATKHGRTPLVLFDGPTVYPLNQKPQSAETGSLREFQVREVCRYYGIPPAVLGEMGGLRGVDIGEMTKAAWTFGIRHHVARILSAFSLRLLPDGERFAVDKLGFIMEDPASLSTLITATREGPNGTGDMTRGEARRLMGLPRRPRDGETLPDPATMNEPEPTGPAPMPLMEEAA